MSLRRFVPLLLSAAEMTLCFACGAPREGNEDSGAGGSTSAESECGSDLAITVVAGTGMGTLFTAFEEGDPLVPYFGSQAGMEVDVSVLLTGYESGDINSIEVSLNVDEAPIGLDTFSPLDLDCEGDSWTIETPVLLDVTEHPTITSVAQLNGREAEIAVKVVGDVDEETSSVVVVLEI